VTTILFLNPWEGLGFMLKRKMEQEDIEMVWKNEKDHPKNFKKHKIRTTPVLLILDKGVESDRLTSTDEIMEYLKKEKGVKDE
tara:strand:- start:89 stop:337 length:249 start_codon:yes stop_codon:yes gene_type:complete